MFSQDTEREVEERERIINNTNKIPIITTTESIEFDNGFKLDLSSIDGDLSDQNTRRRSIDYDYEAINRSNARVGDWQTNFTLIESKVKKIKLNLMIKYCFHLILSSHHHIQVKKHYIVIVKVFC